MPMGTDDKTDRAAELHAAAAFARQRFTAVRDAFNAVEAAHKRGDYSRSPDLQQRLDEFRSAASEVHRLATEFRSATESRADMGGRE